ncbi:uncharacterized protein LOC119465032 isoform X1 [Dermacentor silvarum]|uniref:uncharacterized protein LOC119465032 isoform X1 n=1 Tax=Dermacentor silvarum TaxID=543639 RepID=UPI0021009194|nr:uncharacterized protein LOC119465032 isoform X1 [Dermacentor silvarum]
MILCIFVSVLAIASANFDYPGRPDLEDVKKFYQPGSIIYSLKRTYFSKIEGEDPICIHNKVENFSDSTITLMQGYAYHSGKISVYYPVKMDVSRATGYDVAPLLRAVQTSPPDMKRQYFFHYYDPVAQCAVLTFKDYTGTLRCELHTWKEKASYKFYGNCQDEYDYQCPGRKSHSVYLYDCPNAASS